MPRGKAAAKAEAAGAAVTGRPASAQSKGTTKRDTNKNKKTHKVELHKKMNQLFLVNKCSMF